MWVRILLCFVARSGRRLHHQSAVLMWLGVAATLSACGDAGRPATPTVAASQALPEAVAVRFVKLEEVTEWNGKAFASVAEFNLIDATGAAVDRAAWKASADSEAANDTPANAIDGNPASIWHSQWDGAEPPPPHALTVDLGAAVKVSGFRYLPRQDKSTNGTIAQYRFYVSADGVNWGAPVATGDFVSMSAPSIEKVVIFAAQHANRAPVVDAPKSTTLPMGREVSQKVAATDPDGDALAFEATGLPTGLAIDPKTGRIFGTPVAPGVYASRISITDRKAPAVTVALGWTIEPPTALAPPAAGEVRFVRLDALSEVNNNPWASMAEFNLVDAAGANLSRVGWTASASSSAANDRPGNAIDDAPGTLWHSQWDGAVPPPPYSFIVDLGRATKVRGFRYLPRQDSVPNGTIAKFRLYTSADGIEWGKPLIEGDFTKMGAAAAEKTVKLE